MRSPHWLLGRSLRGLLLGLLVEAVCLLITDGPEVVAGCLARPELVGEVVPDPHVDTDRRICKPGSCQESAGEACPLLTFEGLDTLEPGQPVDVLPGDGEDLVALQDAAPAAGGPGCWGLGTAALDEQTSHRLTRPPAPLEPQAEPQLLPRPPHDGQLLLGELALGLGLQALDRDVPGGGGEGGGVCKVGSVVTVARSGELLTLTIVTCCLYACLTANCCLGSTICSRTICPGSPALLHRPVLAGKHF